MTPNPSRGEGRNLIRALHAMPLLGDDMYLRMQALNLGVVDEFLMQAESDLLREYIEIESTPVPSAIFVSALTQLWVFGVYELLRTWRQRVREVMTFVKALHRVGPAARAKLMKAEKDRLTVAAPHGEEIELRRWRPLETASLDPNSIAELQFALDSSERMFRRIEALRVHLAKHEMPKAKGSTAPAPGYGRIHNETGAIYYQVLLRGNEVDMISRRDIADDCRNLLVDKKTTFLPVGVRPQLKKIAEWGYGVKRVRVTLANGRICGGVFISWNMEVIGISQHTEAAFDARDVVRIQADQEKPPK